MMMKKAKIIFLVGSLFFLSVPRFAARADTPSLSGEAKRFVERGVAAADAKEWTIASQAFREAQKLEPFHPKILFNLGFSYMNEGRDVLADLWLRAFLALQPDAANAAQVRKEIRRLDVAIEATSGKLIQEAMTQLEGFPDAMTADEKEAFQTPADPAALRGQKIPPDIGQRRQAALGAILFAQTATGHITEAMNFASRMNLKNISEDSLKRFFGQIQVDAGDFAGAEDTLKEIRLPAERDPLLRSLAVAEIASEKLDQAEAHAAMISAASEKAELFGILILKYVRQLEAGKAEQVLNREGFSGNEKSRLLLWIMSGYAKKGEGEKARAAAQDILSSQPADFSLTVPALAVLGRTDEALAALKQSAGDPKSWEKLPETAFLLVSLLCWDGESLRVGEVLNLLGSAKAQIEKKALFAVAVENEDVDGAVVLAKQIPSQERDALIVSFFWRLVQKGQFGKAAKLALASESDLVKARLFLKLADQVSGPESDTQKKRLRLKSFQWLIAAQDVPGLHQLARDAGRDGDGELAARADTARRAMTWIELADYFSRIPATADLRKQVEGLKLKSFDEIPYETAVSAMEWGRVPIYVKAREKDELSS
ncbi:MAG TPA: hypothetical protein PKL97_02925 [Candidatus Omnitrophota bacterium]|nr:hypothetical protein [Candidatus Omnitrophota bacterium]